MDIKMDDDYTHLFPIAVEVEPGKSYNWCGCGKTQTPPLCDKPSCKDKCVLFSATLNEEVFFCNCKHTKNPPWCDGSHGKLLIEAIKKRQVIEGRNLND